MQKKIFNLATRANILLLGICLLGFLLYFPSLFNFFSHDDFFHLKISQVSTFGQFINFFNLLSAPEGFGFYRPLTTQVFYFLSISLFNLNPLPLHLISFAVFFANIILVYKLAQIFLKSQSGAVMAVFLYATSATHFGHLYYLGAFQELGLAFFFFSSVLAFSHFLQKANIRYYLISFGMLLGALMSKEFAVTIPLVLVLVYLYSTAKTGTSFKNVLLSLTPFFAVVLAYLYFHIFHYGVAKGDSYIWVFSPQAANTILWYVLWSFNIPEMLVDFIGPGLRPVPNLFKFYGREIVPIIGMVFTLVLISTGIILRYRKTVISDFRLVGLLSAWFLITLAPVIFLPWHKFAYELTVPLFGVAALLAFLLGISKSRLLTAAFLIIWISMSIMTNILTYKTHWITQGGKAARNTVEYLERSYGEKQFSRVAFYDIEEDVTLPWKPSEQMKNILSDNNFFKVFYGNSIAAYYVKEEDISPGSRSIKARDLLGY